MNRWHWLALLVLASLALLLRLPDLGRRPLHNDEAVNALKLRDLWLKGDYRYDPHEYHGPSLHYGSLPFLWFSGAKDFNELTEARLRHVTVAAGVVLVLLIFLLADGLGRRAAFVAATLAALSPAMVFYSRYFIHEMLLVAFTALALGAGWRWWMTGKLTWAFAAGAGLGLMYATKETFVFVIAAAAVASAVVFGWFRVGNQSAAKAVGASAGSYVDAPAVNSRWPGIAAMLLAAAVVSIPLFTAFFTDSEGLLNSIRTYSVWFNRAGGASPHIYGWTFYLERLLWFHLPKGHGWSEGAIFLLALAGAVAGCTGRGVEPRGLWLVRWLTVYSVALTVIYCAIPYKTPWCLLGFFHGWLLLAGVGAVAIWEVLRNGIARGIYAAVLCGAIGCLAWQSWRASFEFCAARQNPYVYSQTVPHVRDLVERIGGIARVHPTGHNLTIVVMAPESYWPLPYYLRAFPHIGWWDKLAPESETYAPVILASARLRAALDDKSDRRWLMAGLYELRPGMFLELYVELELWKRYVATLPPPRD